MEEGGDLPGDTVEHPGAKDHLNALLDILKFDQSEKNFIIGIQKQKFPDSSEISFDPEGRIHYATLYQIVLFLTSVDSSDVEFQKTVLLTYYSFTTSVKLLGLLYSVFYSESASQRLRTQEKQMERNRIIQVIQKWTEFSPDQFEPDMIESLELFLDQLVEDEASIFIQMILQKSVQNIKKAPEMKAFLEASLPPPPILPAGSPSSWTILMLSPVEVARQLSLVHSDLFMKVSPQDILNVIWKNPVNTTDQLDVLTQRFNELAILVSLTILRPDTVRERAAVLSFWLDVAKNLLDMNNFNCVFAVVYGFAHPSVARLANTIAACTKKSKENRRRYMQLKEIVSIDNDFANYRKLLATCLNPCIPFVGCFRRDIIYIQEGYQNEQDGLINIKKCTECAKIVLQLSKFKNERYNFQHIHRICELLTYKAAGKESSFLMSLSLSREPKVARSPG